jgi:hypothetical protein
MSNILGKGIDNQSADNVKGIVTSNGTDAQTSSLIASIQQMCAAIKSTATDAQKVIIAQNVLSACEVTTNASPTQIVTKQGNNYGLTTSSALASAVAGDIALYGVNDNVFIMTRRWFDWASSGYPQSYKLTEFSASDKANAVGILIVEGGKHIVLALDEYDGTMHWSTANNGSGVYDASRTSIIGKFDGKTNTATIIEKLGADVALAANYCNTYAKSITNNPDGKETGITAGKWWLPSLGELQMIRNHYGTIQKALNICGGTALQNTAYWSSTEISGANAWSLDFYDGININTKASSSYRVRAVTAFD